MQSSRFICFVLLFLTSLNAWAQVITGKVQDAKTLEPLPFANVFINNTTMGTTTDTRGEFILKNLSAGSCELIISYVGYESFKSAVTLRPGESVTAEIKLTPSELELNKVEVTATRDLAWEKKIKKFKKIFLGKDKHAEMCTITNPWVIDFPESGILNKFIAKADEPIEIINTALGYRVMFYLTIFWSDKNGYLISGNVRFEEIPSRNETERIQWEVSRKTAYLHSRHHLFNSMIEQRIRGKGFRLYTERPGYENAKTRSAFFTSELNSTLMPYDTVGIVAQDTQPDFYRIRLKGRVEVHYLNERAAVRTYRDIAHQVSWLRLNTEYIVVNRDGYEQDPSDVIVSGDMSTDRVAGMLPLDYQPGDINIIKEEINESVLVQFQEKAYVHTDKPYYYPGEPLWFKGYMNYRTPGLRDSLSRTVYVELISPKKLIALTKTVEVDSGFFHGDFVLSDTLKAGPYYLRAYTNFSRNFGDGNLFTQPIPVLKVTDKVNPAEASYRPSMDSTLTVQPGKQKYKPRERIRLTLRVKDEDDQLLASHLSISVTDAQQVVSLKLSPDIREAFPFMDLKTDSTRKNFPYPVEYGIGFSGRFMNDNNKTEKAILNVLQLNEQNFTLAQSDESGVFSVSGLHFYDTALFSIQASRENGESYGKALLMKKDAPVADYLPDYKLNVISTQSVQRLKSEYELPPNTIMLSEVMVTARRIEEKSAPRPYGKPDYIIKADQLNTGYGNLLYALQGKVPGLVIRQVLNTGNDELNGEGNKWVVYIQRAATSSITYPKEVLVMVNDALMGGSAADVLASINPATVESVEIKSGISVLSGSLGGFGVLSIYTKTGLLDDKKIIKNLPVVKVAGYSVPRKFRFPDYSDPDIDVTKIDYRSLLYWNPSVITHSNTGTTTVSFYASDLTGKFHIVVEGITEKGTPVRAELFIFVEKNN